MIVREALRQRRRPYIYTAEQVRCLLATALEMPSPRAPLRPLTLYTMVILGYCAGLRLGELTRLALADSGLTREPLRFETPSSSNHGACR
jgi:integrase/recombinase XerD